MTSEADNIGFIGLGVMGFAMATNVRKKMPKSSTMYVYDINEETCRRFKKEMESLGAVEIAKCAKDVAEDAATIISIIPAGSNVKEAYLDQERGVLAAKSEERAHLDEMRIYMECSTIDIETTREVGTKFKEKGMGNYVDCPVSGGVPAAEKGTLSFMMGCLSSQEALKRHNDDSEPDIKNASTPPLVSARITAIAGYMGAPSKLFFCGSLGLGLAAKLTNNYLSCTILLANAEAMAMGIKLGVDKHLLYQIVQNSSGQNWMMEHVCPAPGVVPYAPSSNGYKLGFKAQMLTKDVGLGVEQMKELDVKPSIGEAAMEVYREVAVDERCVDLDGSVVYRYLGGPE